MPGRRELLAEISKLYADASTGARDPEALLQTALKLCCTFIGNQAVEISEAIIKYVEEEGWDADKGVLLSDLVRNNSSLAQFQSHREFEAFLEATRDILIATIGSQEEVDAVLKTLSADYRDMSKMYVSTHEVAQVFRLIKGLYCRDYFGPNGDPIVPVKPPDGGGPATTIKGVYRSVKSFMEFAAACAVVSVFLHSGGHSTESPEKVPPPPPAIIILAYWLCVKLMRTIVDEFGEGALLKRKMQINVPA